MRAVALLPLLFSPAFAQSQQYVVGDGVLRYVFASDPEVGVVLQSIDELRGALPPLTFRTSVPRGQSPHLWEVRLESGKLTHPRRSARFSAAPWPDPVQPRGYTFTWDDVDAGGKGTQTLKVQVLVATGFQDHMARWWISVGRNGPRNERKDAILSVDFPRLSIAAPIAPHVGENPLAAQARARLLVPTNYPVTPVSMYPNQPLGNLLTLASALPGGYEESFLHPGGQNLQFSALYVADQNDARHRRVLYLGSEDRSGWYKRFAYGARFEDRDRDPHLTWRHVYYPPFSDPFANPTNPPPTRHGNTFASAYPVVTGILTARSDEFWFDVCEYYRKNVVEADGISGERLCKTKLANNLQVSPLAKGNAMLSLNIYQEHRAPESLEVHLAARQLLTNPWVTPVEYFHAHSYAPANGIGFYPRASLGYVPGFPQLVTAARGLGINVSVYVYGRSIDDVLGWPIPGPGARLLDIHGRNAGGCVGPPTNACFTPFDYGRAAGRTFLVDRILMPIVASLGSPGVNSVYLDSFVGTGASFGYVDPAAAQEEYAAHGGSYSVAGRRQALEYARTRLRGLGQGEPNAAILSEGIEEYLHDRVDFTQHGWSWMPDHLRHAEEWLMQNGRMLDLRASTVGVAEGARNLTPPLWEAVYHAYSTAQNVPLMITSTPLATNPRHQGNPNVGLTPAEWVDLSAFARATTVVAGGRAGVLSFLGFAYQGFPGYRMIGGSPVRDPWDPADTSGTIYRFVRTLLAAEAPSHGKPFLVEGDLERSLATDPADVRFERTANPTKALVDRNLSRHPSDTAGLWPERAEEGAQGVEVFERLGGYSGFPVPKVLHSVWRAPNGRLGIVLVNWTSAPASFVGSFDPTLYGIAANASYTVERLVHGSPPVPVGVTSGVRELEATTTASGPLWIGRVPAHDVVVLTVR